MIKTAAILIYGDLALFCALWATTFAFDLGRGENRFDEVIGIAWAVSGLSLLALSIVFRNSCKHASRSAWLILFLALTASVVFPRT
jgi:hypothetical protein